MAAKGKKPLTTQERKVIELTHQSNIKNHLFGKPMGQSDSQTFKDIQYSAETTIKNTRKRAKTKEKEHVEKLLIEYKKNKLRQKLGVNLNPL